MGSAFFGLEMSRRALQAMQMGLDVAGHNISNANTDGYTRQVANFHATVPDTVTGLGHDLTVGTGVVLDNIQRARDSFVDRQYRWEVSKQEYWGGRQDTLQKIEALLNEPSENSLHDDMDKFWNAWSDLSKNPENLGARSVVQERALALTDTFHHLAQQISDKQVDLDTDVRVKIHQINTYTQQIKDLNDQIKRSEVAGDNPNDLRDKRDSLIDDLSKLVNVRVIESKDPNFTDRNVINFTVTIGDDAATPPQTLVDDSKVYHLVEPAPPNPDGKPFATLTWADGPNQGQVLNLGDKMGSLQAQLEIRGDENGENGYLSNFASQINTLAKGIADAVNALHRTGQGLPDPASGQAATNLDFFSATDNSNITAANITISDDIRKNINNIATGAVPADGSVNIGDGSVAQAISSLAGGWAPLAAIGMTQTVPAVSFGDYYGANVAQMGVDVQQANRMKGGQDVLVTHMYNQRQSVSGVSLDEEMTNLVKFQKSYTAAARMVTMMDDLLNTILNMGVTK